MKQSIPKLHSVRLKSGGAKLHVFESQSSIISNDLVQDAQKISAMRIKDLTGYAIVAWGVRGDTSSSLRVGTGRYVGLSEAPEFIKNVLIGRVVESD